jgi:ABC-type Na+ efflux pump permease subunit
VSFVWSTAAKDLKRHARDAAGLLAWIGLPLVIGALITSIAGGGEGPKPRAHVLVADLDDSFVSNLLVGALSQDAAGGFIQAEEVEEAEGRARMEDGEATALLVIPDGFARAWLSEEPITLELVTNPSQRILPGIVEEGLGILADGTFYLHRLIGEDLRAFAQGPDSGDTFPDERIAEAAVTVNRIVDRVADRLSPPAIELATAPLTVKGAGEEAASGDPPSFALLFVPGLLVMSLLMMAQGMSGDLWKEREQRTLRRVAASPRSITAFLAGKLLAGGAVMALVSSVALAAAYGYFAIPFATLPFAVLWTVFSGATLTALMAAFQLWASSRRAANVVTMLLTFPLLMVGGSFFPFETMPEGMAAIGRFTPNGWALEQLKAILLQRVVPSELGVSFGLLLGVGLALFFADARRLQAGFAQG